MAVSKRLRYEILRRDSHTCRYCGASAPDVPLRVDHVTPVALGGADTPDNLVTSCEPCNSGKSSASPDAHHVAAVSDDALRWAEAMKQAASDLRDKQSPKIAYREAFKSEWESWTRESGWKTERVELLDGWKGSLDAFYEASLPQEVWPDIIEKAMTNPTVKVDNTFRYACGIAWRMVNELQDRARAIASPPAESTVGPMSAVGQAVVELWHREWTTDLERPPTESERANFQESVIRLEAGGGYLDPQELINAAIHGASVGLADIQEALNAEADQRRADIAIDWCDAWMDLDGASPRVQPPDSFLLNVIKSQVDELADGGVSLDRIRRTAILAGFHHSTELHHGLRANEIEHTGTDAFRQRTVDLWTRSFRAGTNRWPEAEERSAFLGHYNRIVADANFYLNDALAAAVAAGAYGDTDLTTCLSRHLSALEIAAQPLGDAK
ncbi:hypothetical protein GCM10009837_06840 [Streptomyces durmitorensis]|uniref:HNH endonuclease n=1 Tax=Streptomyces durmitorensis TaxID=319947 RepID=A0ABY4PKY8_9ACTN|nr:HNH endonuclease [Streptomyces durmitorensis]UQT54420.1 HNH endonuclease [Streptomyces durmitorensis]